MMNNGDQTIKRDDGKPRISMVPMQIVRDIAQVREHGSRKYGNSESWREVEIHRFLDAFLRHALEMAADIHSKDAESGIEHYKHAAANLAFMCELSADDKHVYSQQNSIKK